ncbi:hypothetical protein [Kribbella caucasensis]|nr:hypothetical protein [Kribbella sp. VKM Ac-2527]
MGDLSEADWAAELEAKGQVVFRQRRRPVVVRLLIAFVPLLFTLPGTVDSWLGDAGPGILVFRSIAPALYLLLIGVFAWQSIAQRPVLTVDRDGVRPRGRWNGLPWTEVGGIGIPSGPKGWRTLMVFPTNVWGRQLTVTQDAVRDVAAFARWLGVLLEEHRRTAPADR